MSSPRLVLRSLALRSLTLVAIGLACDARVEPRAAASSPPAAPAKAPAPAPAPAPSPAPSPVPAVAATAYARAADMEYLEVVHVPRGTPPEKVPLPDAKLPMLVAIHGLGDSPENFQHLIVDLPVAARVIVPRGFDPVETGYSWFPVRARSADVAGLSQGIAAAGDRLAAMITALRQTRPTVGLPVITGFSQGGMLAFELAVHHPELVGGAIPVGGWLPPPLWPSVLPAHRPLPKIVALHGEIDAAVKFQPTLEAIAHLEKLGWPASLRRYPEVGHAIPPVVRRELYQQLQRALEKP